jgi:hypothetical protein
MTTKLITAIISVLMVFILFPHFVITHLTLGVFMLLVLAFSVLILVLSNRPKKHAYFESPITEAKTSNMIPVNSQELEQIVEILKGLGYKAQESKIVAQNALMDTQSGTFQDKVRKAVQMLDKN